MHILVKFQNGGDDGLLLKRLKTTSIAVKMDQLLLDAKRLASRLREHNSSTDTLISQANNVHFKLDAMKQVRM